MQMLCIDIESLAELQFYNKIHTKIHPGTLLCDLQIVIIILYTTSIQCPHIIQAFSIQR